MIIQSQGLRLKVLLKQKGKSIKAASAALGYEARESLSRMFQRDVLPPELIEKAAAYLGVSQSDITGDTSIVREEEAQYGKYTKEEFERLVKERDDAMREALEAKAAAYDLMRKYGKL